MWPGRVRRLKRAGRARPGSAETGAGRLAMGTPTIVLYRRGETRREVGRRLRSRRATRAVMASMVQKKKKTRRRSSFMGRHGAEHQGMPLTSRSRGSPQTKQGVDGGGATWRSRWMATGVSVRLYRVGGGRRVWVAMLASFRMKGFVSRRSPPQAARVKQHPPKRRTVAAGTGSDTSWKRSDQETSGGAGRSRRGTEPSVAGSADDVRKSCLPSRTSWSQRRRSRRERICVARSQNVALAC